MYKNKITRLLRHLFTISFIILIASGCNQKLPDPKWNDSLSISAENPKSTESNIAIDIYIDATTSMEGFAIKEKSIYGQFLDQLEASALSAWKNADVKYYKFGERVKLINRQEFLAAKNNMKFYREKGIFKKTLIDSVIKTTDTNRLSVVITDLFQDEGDVNIMVERIKERCFKKNVMVGIVGIKTEFDGWVYDTPNKPKGYKLKTDERPFYALIFGDTYKMERLFEALKAKEFVKENQILFVSNYIMNSSKVSIVKTKDSKFINKISTRSQMENSFDFSMKEQGKEARFNYELTLDRNPRCIDFDENSITLVVYKKSLTDPKNPNPDSVLTNDIKIENIKREGNSLKATLKLKNDDQKGNYSYLIFLQPNQISGFIMPEWVKEFSTDNPVVNTPSASQTYNLEKLVSRLIVGKNSVTPIYISKSFINIYKR